MTWAQFVEALPVLVAFGMGVMCMAVITYGRQGASAYVRGLHEGRRQAREEAFARRLAGEAPGPATKEET